MISRRRPNHRGRRQPRCEQPDCEHRCDGGTECPRDRGVCAFDGVGAGSVAQGGRGEQQHADVDAACDEQASGHIPSRGAHDAVELRSWFDLAVSSARQGRVQVDRVRHHGGAEHRRGEQDGVGACEPGHETGGGVGGGDVGEQQTAQEPDGDDRQHAHHDVFEGALTSTVVYRQDQHRHGAGDETADEQWKAEQQVQSDRAADDLGDVGGDGHDLGLDPERAPRGGSEPVASSSGSDRPVTTPSLADRYWTRIAMAFATTSTHSSRYP